MGIQAFMGHTVKKCGFVSLKVGRHERSINLAKATASWNDIASFWVIGNPLVELGADIRPNQTSVRGSTSIS